MTLVTPPPAVLLEARDVTIAFDQSDGGRTVVLERFNLQLRAGEILALLGPSGSGKSTLLRILAGLLKPSAGDIVARAGSGDRPTPALAMVFQSFALFPWLDVQDNVELGLRAAGIPAADRRARADAVIELIGLDGFESAYPKELSGGMRQRVGFARALVLEPDVLLMDEPFSALDPLTAENLRTDLLELWIDRRIPTRAIVIVTHSIEEAVYMADRILVLDGSPAHIVAEERPELPHWRDRDSEPFQRMVHRLYTVLTEHRARPLADLRPLIVRLPSVPVGTIAGLLELIHESDGRAPLSELAGALQFDIEDLLGCVAGVELLGFGTAADGQLALTVDGRRFIESPIDQRKARFREVLMSRVPNVKRVVEEIQAADGHVVTAESILDWLERHFSADEARRQLDLLISWGRYADAFSFDAETGEITAAE